MHMRGWKRLLALTMALTTLLTTPALAERAAQNVAREYAKAFPQLAGKFSTHICHSADGIQP